MTSMGERTGQVTPGRRRIRIGIDTGGTFTDVVALDEGTGRVATTKTPSTPSDPATGFMTGIDKVLGVLGATPAEIAAVAHGTTVATNHLLGDHGCGDGDCGGEEYAPGDLRHRTSSLRFVPDSADRRGRLTRPGDKSRARRR